MKSFYTSLILALLLALPLSARAWTVVAPDAYVGADDHGYGDLIEDGGTDYFDIFQAEVTRLGPQLTLEISAEFAGRADDGLFSGSTRDGRGIGYGDLFLAAVWSPHGSAPYYNDNAATGTAWEYVLSLDDRWSASGGTAGLYAVSDGTTLLSDDFMTGNALWRNGQEVGFTPDSGSPVLQSGTWAVDQADGSISFSLDITGTGLAGGGIAYHWAETCANDVIEGYATPEPASMLLFGTGLIGIAFIARRSLKRKADRERS